MLLDNGPKSFTVICDGSIRQLFQGTSVYIVNMMHDDMTNYSKLMFKQHVTTGVSMYWISSLNKQMKLSQMR